VSEHSDRIRREFARQAPEFAAAHSFFGDREIAEWIGSHLPLVPDDSVLDVCGGAGHLSRRLSDRARRFVVIDLTREVMDAGRRSAEDEGVENVEFVEGDAAAMPFEDGAFDVAVSRFAFHHLEDPEAVTREMARVVRPGGHVAIIDMVDGGARHNELERLRDPSHTNALPEEELVSLLRDAGTSIVARDERHQALPAKPWLERAHTTTEEASEQVLEALHEELGGGHPTGLHAHEHDGHVNVAQQWVLLVGRKG
jgi:ubiquinone/menaquinone biosynthesis C-methylase UbiE